jgi:hypothetical protein
MLRTPLRLLGGGRLQCHNFPAGRPRATGGFSFLRLEGGAQATPKAVGRRLARAIVAMFRRIATCFMVVCETESHLRRFGVRGKTPMDLFLAIAIVLCALGIAALCRAVTDGRGRT